MDVSQARKLKVLEEDSKDDPRFAATPADLKKRGIDDFQLYYALKTVARLGGPTAVAAATKPPIKAAAPAGTP